MFKRALQANIEAALADTPVTLLMGPRQSGKSTLARVIAESRPGATYVTLDDATTLGQAQANPEAFVRNRPGLLLLDEVQRVPELFLALKAEVDRLRQPGRFLLTGSPTSF